MPRTYNREPRTLAFYIEGNELAIIAHLQTIARNEHKIRVLERNIRDEPPRVAEAVAKLRARGLTEEVRRARARMKLKVAAWEISLEMHRARIKSAETLLKKSQASLVQRKAALKRKLAQAAV